MEWSCPLWFCEKGILKSHLEDLFGPKKIVNTNLGHLSPRQQQLYNRVEWFSTFEDFWKWSHCCRFGILFGGWIPKNQQFRQSFHFQKITWTWKMNIFFLNLQIPSFYFKEQSPTRKFEIKKRSVFLVTQNGQHCFWPGQSKTNFSEFIFNFILNI